MHEGMSKSSILTITNKDDWCLRRTLVAARIFIERGEVRIGQMQREWSSIRDSRSKKQQKETIYLMLKANINLSSLSWGLNEFLLFQNYYIQVGTAIVVFEFQSFEKSDEPVLDDHETD